MREARYLACDRVQKTTDHVGVPVTDAPPVRWKNVPPVMRQRLSTEDCMDRLIISASVSNLSFARLPRVKFDDYPCTEQKGRPR